MIGEQNGVRDTFGSETLARYKRLYDAYEGDEVINENEAFLDNNKRIVPLIGQSFPNTGIEILLHNLVNPAKSVIAIENEAVTGRTLEMGTTNLCPRSENPQAPRAGQAQLSTGYRSTAIQVHDNPHLPAGVRAGRSDLYQYR